MPAPINDRAMKNFEASFIALSRPFVRYRKLLLPPVWKEFCWFIPSISFLSCVTILYIFPFITHCK